MIRVDRATEPAELSPVRTRELARVAAIAAQRDPSSDDVGTAYAVARGTLYVRQHYKCCYCEFKEQRLYNDAEHYRPKAGAKRAPGSADERGYWWLAWTWENLLFACETCNRSHKRTQFPLAVGSIALVAMQAPPGNENPLLLDPASTDDPIDHIQFLPVAKAGKTQWVPHARNGSDRGRETIRVLQLDRTDLLDHYRDHVSWFMQERLDRLQHAFATGDSAAIIATWNLEVPILINSRAPFAALSHDVLDHHFPAATRAGHLVQLGRPQPL